MQLPLIVTLYFSTIWALPTNNENLWNLEQVSRIIGGHLTSDGDFPYAVAIFYDTVSGAIHFCGGTLINNQWILTAAHCTDGAVKFTILLGITDLTVQEKALILSTTTFSIPSSYDPNTLKDDIALIMLTAPIEFTDYIKAIDYLPSEKSSTGVTATAIGWGLTSEEDDTISNKQYHVKVTTITNSACKMSYGSQIEDTMICTDGTNIEGICEGDSGGPLVQSTNDGKSILIGISSFYSGRGCEKKHPSGFTRTFDYIDWIKNVTGREIITPETTVEPSESTPELSQSTTESSEPTIESIHTSESSHPPTESSQLTSESNQPTIESSEATSKSSQPTIESSQTTSESSQPSTESSQPTTESSQPTSGSNHPTIESSQLTTESSQPASESTHSTIESSQPTSESSQPSTESSQPTSETSQPTTESSQSTSESTQPTTEPSQTTTEFFEPTSKPSRPKPKPSRPKPKPKPPQATSEPTKSTTELIASSLKPSNLPSPLPAFPGMSASSPMVVSSVSVVFIVYLISIFFTF